MSFSENDTFSFWENDAVSEIGTVLEIVPRLQNLGHMAGPSIGNGANHLGLPSDSAIGPSNLGDRKSTRLNSSHSGESRMPSSA